MGKLIVLEGTDGSGKSTQFALLKRRLEDEGTVFRTLVFPQYSEPSSALIRMYLGGEFGENPGDVNAYAASAFFAVDRYASFRKVWGEYYRNGGLILSDRYTTSNAVHQCSKLPREQWDTFLDWLFAYEYDLLGLPAPDTVFYLRVDPAVSLRLLRGRGGASDIHERDRDYQARSREAADYCAARFRWHVVECTRGGELRPVEDIHAEITEAAL